MPSMVKRFYETQMRLLLRVLAWFGLFPGCNIIPAGECYQCITFTIVDRECKSLAKRKRDAEAWYKKDTEMFEGFLHTYGCLTYLCLIIAQTISSAQAKGDYYESAATTLIRKQEKNKISSTERAWLLGGAL
jgi:hypothetical protein